MKLFSLLQRRDVRRRSEQVTIQEIDRVQAELRTLQSEKNLAETNLRYLQDQANREQARFSELKSRADCEEKRLKAFSVAAQPPRTSEPAPGDART
jgi:hypothetical protein